jgi:hypothetical protein
MSVAWGEQASPPEIVKPWDGIYDFEIVKPWDGIYGDFGEK